MKTLFIQPNQHHQLLCAHAQPLNILCSNNHWHISDKSNGSYLPLKEEQCRTDEVIHDEPQPKPEDIPEFDLSDSERMKFLQFLLITAFDDYTGLAALRLKIRHPGISLREIASMLSKPKKITTFRLSNAIVLLAKLFPGLSSLLGEESARTKANKKNAKKKRVNPNRV